MRTIATRSKMARTITPEIRVRARKSLLLSAGRRPVSAGVPIRKPGIGRRQVFFLSAFPHANDFEDDSPSDEGYFGSADDSTDQPQPLRRAEIVIDASTVRIPVAVNNVAACSASHHHHQQEHLHLPIPWLWLNDPRNIQKRTGQKLQTPLSFYAANARIVGAAIVPSSPAILADDHYRRVSVVPKGSLHPVGGMWQTNKHPPLNEEESSLSSSAELLRVTWQTNDAAFDSYYSLDWLLERHGRARGGNGGGRTTTPTRVQPPAGIGSTTKLFTMEYSQLFPDDDAPCADHTAQFHLLDAVFRDGAALVQGAPVPAMKKSDHDDDDLGSAVARVGRLLGGGRLSHGHLYGDVFHVATVPDAINIAYTSVALAPHQDLAYYESPPGLQLLHCVENTLVTGGASTLVDALAATHALRTIAPTVFRCLTETNATFIKQREKADMCYRRPHIRLDASGERVVAVHWSPPFEGPLEGVLDELRVKEYYVAHAAFQRMIDNSLPSDRYLLQDVLPNQVEDRLVEYANQQTWERQLQVGDMLVFNNQRMLHGRRSFTLDCPATSRRHLMGVYTNIDDTISEYRLLRREQPQHQQGHEELAPVMAGNGSA
jgi:alpha-ketoglutarate-dependent taurine dioxygenase